MIQLGFPGGSVIKNSPINAGDVDSIPGLGTSPETEMAICFSILAWKNPWTLEPGGLQSMGLQKSRTWLSDSTTIIQLRLQEEQLGQISFLPAPFFFFFFLPLSTFDLNRIKTEKHHAHFLIWCFYTCQFFIWNTSGEGNSNPFKYSRLENPMDRRARGLQSMGLQRVRQNWATNATTTTI